jgi:flagellar hook-length control protein FliK
MAQAQAAAAGLAVLLTASAMPPPPTADDAGTFSGGVGAGTNPDTASGAVGAGTTATTGAPVEPSLEPPVEPPLEAPLKAPLKAIVLQQTARVAAADTPAQVSPELTPSGALSSSPAEGALSRVAPRARSSEQTAAAGALNAIVGAASADVAAAMPAPSDRSFGDDAGNSPKSSSWTQQRAAASSPTAEGGERAAKTFVADVHVAPALTPTANAQLLAAGVASQLGAPGLNPAWNLAVNSMPNPGLGAAPATMPDVSEQLVQAVRMQWNDGVGEARITLQPEYLGGVSISLHVDQGGVTAVLHADSAAVRTWLQSNEPLLSQGLSEQGLTLERLVVAEQPPTEDGGAPRDGARDRQEQPRRQSQKSDAGSFEIIL